MVVWSSRNQDGNYQGVCGQRFASSGARFGAEFQVSLATAGNQVQPVYTTGAQSHSGLGLAVDGGLVVVWQTPQDGSDDGVVGRQFDSLGTGVGEEFAVNSYPPGDQTLPAMAATLV